MCLNVRDICLSQTQSNVFADFMFLISNEVIRSRNGKESQDEISVRQFKFRFGP